MAENEMNIDNVFISEFDTAKPITYPETETPGNLDRQPCDLTDEDFNFNHGITLHPGFRIHHVETLQPVIYYLRGLIDHETSEGTVTTGKTWHTKRYVFSARINLNNFGHDDFLELLDKVIDKIKSL